MASKHRRPAVPGDFDHYVHEYTWGTLSETFTAFAVCEQVGNRYHWPVPANMRGDKHLSGEGEYPQDSCWRYTTRLQALQVARVLYGGGAAGGE